MIEKKKLIILAAMAIVICLGIFIGTRSLTPEKLIVGTWEWEGLTPSDTFKFGSFEWPNGETVVRLRFDENGAVTVQTEYSEFKAGYSLSTGGVKDMITMRTQEGKYRFDIRLDKHDLLIGDETGKGPFKRIQ